MVDSKARQALIADMRDRTAALRADAARLDDEFLQYLYGLPLTCLEEKALPTERPPHESRSVNIPEAGEE